jgi:hypothetical protein
MNEVAIRTLEDTLLVYLRAHRGQRFTREQLVWAMKTSGFDVTDRGLRKAIEYLRANHPEGGWVVSSSDEAGYVYAQSEAEVRAAQAEDGARIQATSAKMHNRDRLLRDLEQERTMMGRMF